MEEDSFDAKRKSIIDLSSVDMNKALQAANAMIEDHPEEAGFWSARSYLFWKSKKYPEAIDDIDKAIALCPSEPASYFEKSDYLISLGDFLGAISLLSQAIEIGERSEFFYYEPTCRAFRAFCFCKLGDFERARADLASLTVENPIWIDQLRTKAELLEACERRHLD